jgi:hypothetical protein
VFTSSAQNVCPILSKFGITRQTVINISNTKFQENPTSWSRGDTCWHIDMMKLVRVFCNYANDLVTTLWEGHAVCILAHSSNYNPLYLRQTWNEHAPLQDKPTLYHWNTTISNNVADLKICQARMMLLTIQGPIHDSRSSEYRSTNQDKHESNFIYHFLKRQAKYVKRNTETCSCNQCCKSD